MTDPNPLRGQARASQYALDRSLRSVDADGHMRVEESRISKANVSPYRGSEIPNWQALGLNPNRVYRLYRDAEELKQAAQSFEGKPLLIRHVAIDGDTPRRELWVGTVGKVTYEHPYLVARPLMVLTREAIELIESEEQRELSSAYRYDAIMTPGNIDGQAYDGRMINIRGNHVAIVSEGRVGPDVHVADEKPKEFRDMKNLSLIQRLLPFLRSGASLIALDKALGEVPAESVMTLDAAEMKAAEDEAKKAACDARGADAEPSEEEKEEAYERARDRKAKDKKAKDAKAAKDKKAKDESEEEEKAKDESAHKDVGEVKGKDKKAKDSETDHRKDFDPAKDGVTKDELPAILKAHGDKVRAEVRAEMQALQVAREAVKPIVGTVSMALDSSEGVYKFALEQLGVNLKGVAPESYATLFEVHQSATKKGSKPAPVAMDSSNVIDFDTEFSLKRRA